MIVVLVSLGLICTLGAVLAASLALTRVQPGHKLGALQWLALVAACVVLEGVALVIGFIPFWLSEKHFTAPGQGASFVAMAWIVGGPVMSFIVLPAVYAAVTMPALPRVIRYAGPPVVLVILLAALAWRDIASAAAAGLGPSGTLEPLAYAVLLPVAWLVFAAGLDAAAGWLPSPQKTP